MTDAPVTVENVETVNVSPAARTIPYVGIIAAVSAAILIGFAAVSWHLLTDAQTSDETRGAIVATWNNLAVAVGAFWLGSSVGGKMSARP